MIAEASRLLISDSSSLFEIFRPELFLQTYCDLFANALNKMQRKTLYPFLNSKRYLSLGIWSLLTAALKHLKKSIAVFLKLENKLVIFVIGKPNGPTPFVGFDIIFWSIRLAISDFHLDSLLSQFLEVQSFALVFRSLYSFHLYRSDNWIRFVDWKFSLSARLYALQTGFIRSRFSINNRCTRCQRNNEN